MLRVHVGQKVAIRYLGNRPRLGFVVWEITDNAIVVDSHDATEIHHFGRTGAGIKKSKRWTLVLNLEGAALENIWFDIIQEAAMAVRGVRVKVQSVDNSVENLEAKVEMLEEKLQQAKALIAKARKAERPAPVRIEQRGARPSAEARTETPHISESTVQQLNSA